MITKALYICDRHFLLGCTYCDYINCKEWRGCLYFTGLWNFLPFCLSGILVSYFFGWFETFFGGEVGCLLPLALYKFSWCWGWYREVRPCDGACLNTVQFEINEALASWLINVCGVNSWGGYSWFKSVLIFRESPLNLL